MSAAYAMGNCEPTENGPTNSEPNLETSSCSLPTTKVQPAMVSNIERTQMKCTEDNESEKVSSRDCTSAHVDLHVKAS